VFELPPGANAPVADRSVANRPVISVFAVVAVVAVFAVAAVVGAVAAAVDSLAGVGVFLKHRVAEDVSLAGAVLERRSYHYPIDYN